MEIRLNAVPDKGSHGDAAVLDLSVAKEANGGLVGVSPKVLLGKADGVVKLDHGVGGDGQFVKACVWLRWYNLAVQGHGNRLGNGGHVERRSGGKQ